MSEILFAMIGGEVQRWERPMSKLYRLPILCHPAKHRPYSLHIAHIAPSRTALGRPQRTVLPRLGLRDPQTQTHRCRTNDRLHSFYFEEKEGFDWKDTKRVLSRFHSMP